MYTEQDYDVIKNRMLNSLNSDIDKREGSFVNDMYSPMSIEFAKAYIEMDNLHSIMFVNSAFDEDLDNKVSEFGVLRKLGERAKGTVKFLGDNDTLVPRNMSIFTDGGYEYVTISQSYIKEGYADILVEAKEIGEIYNIEASASWLLPKDITVNELSNPLKFEGGVDIEADEDLRIRFFDTVQNVRTSGNKNDYEYWAKEVTGVFNAEVYPKWNGANSVKVVASGENRLPLESGILKNCENHIKSICPVCSNVTVITTSLFNVSIVANVTVSSDVVDETVKAEVEKAIRDYLGTCTDKIYYNKLVAKMLSCNGVIDYSVLTVNGLTSATTSIPVDSVVNIQAITITTSVGA